MKEETAISVENVSKTFRIPHEKVNTLRGAFVGVFRNRTYEKFKALDDISFEVKKGEFFGIIGRNGSGKSTLLKILAGIYQADRGKFEINGMISPFLELGIGFNPELSGRDNIYLNASVLGLSQKQIDKKFDDIVKFSELERFIDQKLKNYSSGMQVRLAFSVAIHANRDILLMDEVLAVGDSNFQYKCLAEFTKYRDLGKTVILVTHDMLTAQKYCDRLMLLREGKIEVIGDPNKVGSEYIFQNMSDEEKRILVEEKERKAKTEKEMKKRMEVEAEKAKKEEMRKKAETEEVKKEEKRDLSRWGNRDVFITKTEVLDSEKKTKRVFNPFDDMVIRIYYENKKDLKKAVFGVEIADNNNYKLFGFNTSFIKKAIGIEKNGYVDFKLRNIPFLNGRYNITPAIANENCNIQYDYWRDAIYFVVMNNDYKGYIYGNINIKLDVE
jgi:lipopolysaccharide transport system ATP-binding protein